MDREYNSWNPCLNPEAEAKSMLRDREREEQREERAVEGLPSCQAAAVPIDVSEGGGGW